MSQTPPTSISLKRRRHEAPVDALVFEHTVKRQKSQTLDNLPKASPGSRFYFKRLTKPNDTLQQSLAPPTPTAERRFHLEPRTGLQRKHVFVEARDTPTEQNGRPATQPQEPVAAPIPEPAVRPRKRPGAGSALRSTSKPAPETKQKTTEPSEEHIRELEAFSQQVEKEDNLHIPLPSPSKHKPKVPAQRFAERHPDKAAALAAHDANDGDAMDIDTDEYVYDTYVREPLLPDANGQIPEPTTLGTVGFLVIGEDDEDWWNGDDESDKEFDTDDEDENAEDYYANDYPEDELSEDDEFDRNLYQKKYRHGSDDEEFDLNDDGDDDVIGSDEDEDDLHFKMTVPKAQKPGYWGAVGE